MSVAATYLVIGIRSAPLGAPLPRSAVRPDGLIRHAYPVRSRGRVQSGYPGCPGAPHQPAQLAVRPAAKLRSAARLEPGPVAVALVAPSAGELGLGRQNAANASGASSAIASAPPAASAPLAAALPAAASPTMSSRAPSTPATSAATAGATSSTRSTRCSGTDSSMTTGSSRTPSPRSPPIAGPW